MIKFYRSSNYQKTKKVAHICAIIIACDFWRKMSVKVITGPTTTILSGPFIVFNSFRVFSLDVIYIFQPLCLVINKNAMSIIKSAIVCVIFVFFDCFRKVPRFFIRGVEINLVSALAYIIAFLVNKSPPVNATYLQSCLGIDPGCYGNLISSALVHKLNNFPSQSGHHFYLIHITPIINQIFTILLQIIPRHVV